MGTTLHSTIADPDIHEPKGVAAAASGKVYKSDGAGSGSWDTPTEAPSSWVVVSSASDFPTPVANVITLAANTVYYVSGAISIGDDRFVFANNSFILGTDPNVDIITTTNTGNTITGVGVNVRIEKIGINSTGTGADIFAVSGSTTGALHLVDVRINACDTLGSLTALSEVDIRELKVQSATTSGLSFSGAFANFFMSYGILKATAGTLLSLGTATFDIIDMADVEFQTTSGITGLAVAASGANLNSGKIGDVRDCFFDSAGTPTSGYAVGDINWDFHSCSNVENNEKDADLYMQGNATGTSATTTPTLVAGTWSSATSDQFTNSTAGRATYNGLATTGFSVSCSIFAAATSGSAQKYYFYIAKNGTIIQASRSTREFTTSTPGALSVFGHVEMATGDYIETYVEKESGSDTLTVEDIHMVASAVN